MLYIYHAINTTDWFDLSISTDLYYLKINCEKYDMYLAETRRYC